MTDNDSFHLKVDDDNEPSSVLETNTVDEREDAVVSTEVGHEVGTMGTAMSLVDQKANPLVGDTPNSGGV